MNNQMLRALRLAVIVSAVAGLPGPMLQAESQKESEEAIDWRKEREFWSFRLPAPKMRPSVKNNRWPSQPLDYFVLARLEQTNLAPSVEADKRTLLRRVTYDLTGLPPTPEEVLTFL